MDTPKRWTDPQTDNRYYKDTYKQPSVTTILSTRDSDTGGLDNWRRNNNGEDDNPDWQHLFWYKRHRGTLCHWAALSQVADDLPYSRDEYQSRYELYLQHGDEVAADSPREVLYSVLKDRDVINGYGDMYQQHNPHATTDTFKKALWDVVDSDIAFFKQTFAYIIDTLNIDSIVAVERFLLNHKYGFGGQVDLVIRYEDGTTAICDLKTSSGNRDKNKLQLAAYAKAVEMDDDIDVDSIDHTEVWRIHPDTGTFQLHSNVQKTPLHTTSYWNESLEDSWGQFHELCFGFHDEIDVQQVTEPDTET